MTIALHEAETEAEIAACFPVMRELRPHLANAEEFVTRVRRQRKDSYRLLAAWKDVTAVGVAGWRVQETLIRGRFCYVDDLVVAEGIRHGGLGARLLKAVAAEARALRLSRLVLDTAIDNFLGQRFYFRHGMLPVGMRFAIALG
jgi:GNAT superfamily N-acetyltransferase